MKKYLSLIVVILTFIFFPYAHGVSAQDEVVSPQNEEDEINYSYGVVVSQSPNQIVLLEYDYDRDEEVQVTYEVNAETKVENVESLDKLQKDDNIEIYYKEMDGRKIAVSIEKELLIDEDATITLPDDTTEDVVPEETNTEDVPTPKAE